MIFLPRRSPPCRRRGPFYTLVIPALGSISESYTTLRLGTRSISTVGAGAAYTSNTRSISGFHTAICSNTGSILGSHTARYCGTSITRECFAFYSDYFRVKYSPSTLST